MSFMMKATVFLSLRILWCNAPTLPVPGGERYTNANFAYSQEYLIQLNAALVERAKQHGLRMATYEEVLELSKSSAQRVAVLIRYLYLDPTRLSL